MAHTHIAYSPCIVVIIFAYFPLELNTVDGGADEDNQAEAMDSAGSDAEDAMETNDAEAVNTATDAMDTEVSDSARPKEGSDSQLKAAKTTPSLRD